MSTLTKIGNGLLTVLKIIGWTIANIILFPALLISTLITGGIKMKFFILALIGGLIVSFFLNKVIFFILVGCIVAFLVICAVWIVIPPRSNHSLGQSVETPTMKDRIRNHFIFRGLAPDDAKKRYRELQKQYHPDNASGDAEMSREINDQYREYCEAQAKQQTR